MPRPRKPPEEQELIFQQAYTNWKRSSDQQALQEMWLRVKECCSAIAKKICMGIYNPLIEDRIMDATCLVMRNILCKDVHPEKLSSYCYWPTRSCLQGPKQQREDQEMSLDFYFQVSSENSNEYKEEIRGILRQELMNTLD